MYEMKNNLVYELESAKHKSEKAYRGMRFHRDKMESQQKKIKELLGELEILLVEYQGTCNNFHAAQSEAIKACHDERIIREMIDLYQEL